jgi:NADPH-dependent curcumin reductase CurA
MGIFQRYQIISSKGLTRRLPDNPNVPYHYFLGILGLTGLSAFIPLMKIGKPKEGETLFVSGAAGAVGLVVGQIGKILGL